MLLDENQLKRIPVSFILMLLFMLGVPIAALSYVGLTFNDIAKNIANQHSLPQFLLESQISNYFKIAFLQWSVFFLSTISSILALTQYRLTHDKRIYVIAMVQMTIVIYLMSFSTFIVNNTHHIIYFLSILLMFVPILCLMIHSVLSYNRVIESQKKLRHNQETLHYMATHDPLTELYNRRQFEHVLNQSVNTHTKQNHYFALFILDIDNFKSINDTWGHIRGDEFLKKFSKQLMLLTRPNDILARIGGDEFALLTTQLPSPYVVKKLAERIQKGLRDTLSTNNELAATVSIGIAIYPLDGENAKTLLNKADRAMYHAKNTGKNTYQFYKEQAITI